MTTGVLLVDVYNNVADLDGNIIHGPKSDKEWLSNAIRDKVVTVGIRTWLTDISNYPKLISRAKRWLLVGTAMSMDIELPYNVDWYISGDKYDICLGGPKTIYLLEPDRLILHKIGESSCGKSGIKIKIPKCYKLKKTYYPNDDYLELIYEK